MPEGQPTLRDRPWPITNPLAMMALILLLGFSSPFQLSKLWFPLRLAVTLLGLALLAWVTVFTYDRFGLLTAIVAFALTNVGLAAIWFCTVLVLGILLVFQVNRRP